MLKLDMAAFVNAAKDLPECTPEACRPFGTTYLTQHIVLPFLHGEAVRLSALDFNAFDEDDIHALWTCATAADEHAAPILRLFQPVLSAHGEAARRVPFV